MARIALVLLFCLPLAFVGRFAAPVESFSLPDADLYEPRLAVAPDGAVLLVGLGFEEGGEFVFASAMGEAGWGEPQRLAGPGSFLDPAVIAAGPGRFQVVWAAIEEGRSDLHGRVVADGKPGPAQRITDDAGQDSQPTLARGRAGELHLAWQSFRDGRLDVFRAIRGPEGWGAPTRVTDHASSDAHPTLALDPAGRLWVAWTTWRDGTFADGNYQIYTRCLDDEEGRPAAVSRARWADTAPRFVSLESGLALAWTESYFPIRSNGELQSVAYDRWSDKIYRVSWMEDEAFGDPVAVRLTGNVRDSETITDRVLALPGGPTAPDEVWLIYGELIKTPGMQRPWGAKLCRVAPTGPSEPVGLARGVLGPGEMGAAWREGRLLLAETVSLMAEGPLAHTRVDVKSLNPRRLKAAPAGERVPKERVAAPDGLMGGEPSRDERTRMRHGESEEEWTAWFGNLHLHSDFSWDVRGFEGPPSDNYQFVHDMPEVDFAGLSDHVETMTPSTWHAVREAADLWNLPGHFVTLPGYEWTSVVYGHKNVFFPDREAADDAATFSSRTGAEGEEQHTPAELWEHLGERAAVTIPHHVSHAVGAPTDWSFRDDRFQRLVEIFQVRGSYEYDGAPYQKQDFRVEFVPGHSVRDALGQGHRLGIMASPDHGGGLGLTGVWSSELTRAGIFEALHARRTFGTTGAKMDLFLAVAGAAQGAELEIGPGPVQVRAVVHGTADDLELTLVSDGEELWQRSFEGRTAELEWSDERPLEATRYYYLRAIQGDGHMGWTSPVWVTPR